MKDRAMDTKEGVQVVSAEQLDGGVVVSFTDGRSILYSTQLLLSIISQARELLDDDD